MTRNVFVPARFGFYLKKYLTENRKKLLILVMEIALAIVFVVDVMPWIDGSYKMPSDYDVFWNLEYGWMMFAFILLSGLTGAMFYGATGSKSGRIMTFMTPASAFEMFLTFFLVHCVGFVVVFAGVAVAADWIRVWTSGWYAVEGATVMPIPLDYIVSYGLTSRNYEFGVLIFVIMMSEALLFNAFNVLGSIVFEKRPFGKTLGSLAVLAVAAIFLMNKGFGLFLHGSRIEPRMLEDASPADVSWMIGGGAVFLAVVIIYISFVRFKETEIINRW